MSQHLWVLGVMDGLINRSVVLFYFCLPKYIYFLSAKIQLLLQTNMCVCIYIYYTILHIFMLLHFGVTFTHLYNYYITYILHNYYIIHILYNCSFIHISYNSTYRHIIQLLFHCFESSNFQFLRTVLFSPCTAIL